MRQLALLVVLAVSLSLSPSAGAQAWVAPRAVGRFPVVFHVPSRDGTPIASDADLRGAIDDATRAFRPAGVCLGLHATEALDGDPELRDIRSRRRLARFVQSGAAHVFVVERMLDPHPSAATERASAWMGREPTGLLSGAHIPVRARFPETYVIVTRSGLVRSRTLAHELGHFFGAIHSRDETNIMSYGRERLRFDEAQLRMFHMRAVRWARRRDWVAPIRAEDCPLG